MVSGVGLGAVDLNFNGWGKKQTHKNDSKVARFVAEKASAIYMKSRMIGEGGGIEVDGHGTALLTESCIVNKNRNPKLDKAECEKELKKLLGLRSVIWLPGIRNRDITDGHIDFYARFTSPGNVLAGLESDPESYDHKVTRQHFKILVSSHDADDRKLRVLTLNSPLHIRDEMKSKDFAAGYINYYVVNGAVIAPEFGDMAADANCKVMLEKLFPKRKVILLNIDAIAAGGGGIHCVTLHEPLSSAETISLPSK